MHAKIKWSAAARELSQWKQNQGISMFQLCLYQCFPASLGFTSLCGLETDGAKRQPVWILEFYFLFLLEMIHSSLFFCFFLILWFSQASRLSIRSCWDRKEHQAHSRFDRCKVSVFLKADGHLEVLFQINFTYRTHDRRIN